MSLRKQIKLLKEVAQANSALGHDRWISAGGVVLPSENPEDWDKVYVVRSSFDGSGFSWEFPKGRVEPGESPDQAALREVKEETSIEVALVGDGYLGRGETIFSIVHYFLMYAKDTSKMKPQEGEVLEIKLVPFAEAIQLFYRTQNGRDQNIAEAAQKAITVLRQRVGYIEKEKQVGLQTIMSKPKSL